MEYIARVHDEAELARVRKLLRDKGIPTHAQLVEHRSIGAQWGLYVCLAEQREDALKLLRDPAHEPKHPVDAHAFERALADPDQTLLVRWSTITAITVLILVVAVVYLVRQLG